MNTKDKEYKKLVRRRRLISLIGILGGILIVIGGASILFNINPITKIHELTSADKQANSKVSFDEKNNTLITPNAKFILNSYDTATATVDVNDPNQLNHKLILIFYSFTNTSGSDQRPFTEWEKYVTAYQGKNKLAEGMQLIETSGPNIDLENTSVTDQAPGATVDALAHFDFNPNDSEPVILRINNEDGEVIHKITYDLTNK